MKSKLIKIVKRPIALLLAVCMTVTLFVTPSSAEDTESTGNSGASSEKIDDCKTIARGYTAVQASNYIAGDNTYPTLDGYVFAGWYTDAACTKLLDGASPSGTTYALFVPNHVLSVKAQISSGLTTQNWQSKDKSSIRFVTTVDSLRYDEIGFDISYVDKEQKVHTATKSSTQVYNSLYECGSNEKVWKATPEGTFCGLSQYFSLCTLKDFTLTKYFETEFTIKPYWITADGDKVYGVTATKSMKEGCLKQEVSITINETDNGTVTKAAEAYKVGETVQITATPNAGYNLTSLTVTKDGTAVDIGTVDFAGGTYSFVAEGGSYVVDAEFKQKIFVEAEGWDLTKQYEGEIALNSTGKAQYLDLYGQYTNFDFTIKVKDDPTIEDNSNDHRTTVKLVFDNNFVINTSVHESPSSSWVVIQNVPNEGNTYNSKTYDSYYIGAKQDADWMAYHTAEGIDYRVVRQGTNLMFYLNGTHRKTLDLSSHINANTKVEATIIHHNGDAGMKIDIPYTLRDDAIKPTIELVDSAYGTLQINNSYEWVGDEIVISEKELTDSNYYLAGLKIDGKEVELALDGTYSFVATKSKHTVEGIYKKAIFDKYTNVSLVQQNESTEDGVTSGTIWVTNGGYVKPILKEKYTDIDFTINIKDADFGSDESHSGNNSDHRRSIQLVFDKNIDVNGVSKPLVLNVSVYENTSVKQLMIGRMSWEDNNYPENFSAGTKANGAEWKAYHTEEGVDFRVVRQGTKLMCYLNGTRRVDLDLSTYIDADTTMNVKAIYHGSVNGAAENIPFVVSKTLRTSQIQFATSDIGSLTTEENLYYLGDTVVVKENELTDSDYYLAGLKIDGKEVELALDGTYSFVATKSKHTVEGIYKKAIFDSNGRTNVSLVQQNQGEEDGVTTGTIWVTDGKYTYPIMKDSYTDIDFSISVKDGLRSSDEAHGSGEDHRRTIKLTFDKNIDVNGESKQLVLCVSVNENLTDKHLRLGSFNSEGDNYPDNFGKTTENNGVDWKAYHTAEGVDFRVVRQGQKVMGYLNGTCMTTLDLSSYIDADTTMKVTVIYHGGETGQQFDIPYALRHIPSNQINIVSSEYGSIAMTSTNNLVGEEVVFKQEAWLNDNYYLSGLIIDGTEVELDSDGTYRFVTTKSEHTVEGIYREAIFVPNSAWSLAKQNLSTADGVTNGEISLVANKQDKLEFQKQYTDMDLTLRVKDDQSDDTKGRTSVEFTFDNGETFNPSIGEGGLLQIKACTVNGNKWASPYPFTEDEKAAYTSSEGIDFRIVRNGTVFTAYITDVTNPTQMKEIWTADYEEHIDADTEATVTITHDDDKGIKIVMPFVLKLPQEITSYQGEKEDG